MQQMYIKPCRRCNKLFKGIKSALYCDNCRLAMRYVYNKRYYERKKVRANRTLGQQYVCTNCGCKYILASGMQNIVVSVAQKYRMNNMLFATRPIK